MKKNMRNTGLSLLLVCISTALYAWNPPASGNGKGGDGPNPKAAGCVPSQEYIFMGHDTTVLYNNTMYILETGGSMWQNRFNGNPTAAYFMPRPANGATVGTCTFFAGALWMAGTDVNGQLKIAADLYRQGNDFWPGPLSQTPFSGNYDPTGPVSGHVVRDFGAATITPDVCLQYDKFFPIQKADVIKFSTWWECNDTSGTDCEYPSSDVMDRILNWPAHGDVGRGQDYYLAPFFDRQLDGDEYDPINDGDYPWYDLNGDIDCRNDRRVTLFGDYTNWWVFNDKGNIHTETHGEPIGMEVHAQSFLFATNDEINNMSFYNYEMINRGTQKLQDTYFAQYADPDLGGPNDDYVGCDISRGLGYCYNADNQDDAYQQSLGYGPNPPAAGIDFFEGPYQDDDGMDNPGPHQDSTGTSVQPSLAEARAGNGIVYSGLGIGYGDGVVDNERYGMKHFFVFYRSDVGGALPGINDDPSAPADYYLYLRGYFKDGTRMVYGGLGHISTTGADPSKITDYAYPNDSDPYGWGTPEASGPSAPWSELNGGGGSPNPQGDRRFLQVAGPFTLTPGAVNNITVGVLYSRSTESDLFASVRSLEIADTKAQALFDNCFQILEPPTAPKLEIQELENELILTISNPAGGNNVNELYTKEDKVNIIDPNDSTVYDKFYRFEGYQIYQMSDATASIGDITDNDKARLVVQCDIVNGVSKLINYDFNQELNVSEPKLMVSGADKGIKHSFKITEDQYNNTAPTLVNHKTYYYLAIAYAYNNYKTYDPTDPTKLDGQKKPYISSRLSYNGSSVSSVAGIPHNPMPEAGGTYQEVEYGDEPQITRIEGIGNGGTAIDLIQSSSDYIVEHDSIQFPTYEKGAGPVNIKVIDPLNLAKGYFSMKFYGYNTPASPTVVNYPSDSSDWVIYHYDKKGGTLIDSINSERTIKVENEQLIPDWGVSVDISQIKYYALAQSIPTYSNLISTPIEATQTYTDSSHRWLFGLQDVDGYTPQNWILSGTQTDTNGNNKYYKDYTTLDTNSQYEKLLNGTITHFSMVRVSPVAGSPIMDNSKLVANSARQQSAKADAVSIDLIITSDKSKWTRSPVIEMCQDKTLSQGNAEVSMMRIAPSVDKNGKSAGESGYNSADGDLTNTQGMGWFPGYAIDVETGKRLNIAFGENSFLSGENGSDMIWNPTGNIVDHFGNYVLGGMHTIYVMGININKSGSPAYDKGAWFANQIVPSANSSSHRVGWQSCMWVAYPLTNPQEDFLATDVKIRVRICKEYRSMYVDGENAGRPMYTWDTDDMGTITNDTDALSDALKLINVVPNPYYAFSEYEQNRLDTRVKITNLPDKCDIQIFSIRGQLIRSYKKDNSITSLDWDLKNTAGIPIAGGVYLIHVKVPDIPGKKGGERILKWFGGIRQPDLQNL